MPKMTNLQYLEHTIANAKFNKENESNLREIISKGAKKCPVEDLLILGNCLVGIYKEFKRKNSEN